MARLQEGDEEEAAKVFTACKEDGAFYLDFSNQKCKEMMKTVDEVSAASRELFQSSEEEKMKYDIDLLGKLKLNGYKPVGRNFGGR